MSKMQNHRVLKMQKSDSMPKSLNQSPLQQNFFTQKMYNSQDPGNEIIRQKEEAFHYLRQEKIGLCLEKILNVIEAGSEYFDKDSAEFRALFNEVVQVLSDYAMKLLQLNQFERSIDILMTCRKLTDASLYYEQVPEKRILVLNNLGCVFRKMGRLGKARIFLEEAFSLVQKFPHIKYSGITYMNICAVVSQAGMHDRAIQYARFGLQECQRQLLEFISDPVSKRDLVQLTEKVKFAAISFHNVGIEEEYFQNYDKAKDNLRQSYTLFEDHGLSLQDPLYLKFKQSYIKCVQNSMNTDKSLNKSNLIKLDRPRSSHQVQATHVKQNSGDGFYFQNNKLVPKKKQTDQMAQTQVFPKNRSMQSDMLEDQNFRQTAKNNYFGHNQSQNDYTQGSPAASFKSEQPNRNRRRTSPDTLNNSQRRPSNLELRKEIKDMQLIGILDWSDSDKSEDEFEINKNNRIDFIKQLQGDVVDDSIHVSKVIESPKQDLPLQISKEEQQTPRQKQNDNLDNSLQQAAQIASQPSKQSLKSMKSLKSEKNQSVVDSPTSARNQTQQQSIKKLESNRSVSKRTSKVETENNLSSSIIPDREYGEEENQAVGRIQQEWKKQKTFKENKKKLVIQNRKKLIVLRQKKMEQSAVVIQKQFRKYKLKKDADFQKSNKKQKEWIVCSKVITKLVDQLSLYDSHDQWQFSQDPHNINYRRVKLTFYYNQKMDQMRITGLEQNDSNFQKVEIEEINLNLKELQNNKKYMQSLNSLSNNLQSVNDLKNLAKQLKDQIYICSNQLRLIFIDTDLQLVQEGDEYTHKKRNRVSRQEQNKAATKIQSYQKKRESKEKVDLIFGQKIKRVKKWVVKPYINSIFIEICIMQDLAQHQQFIKVKDLSTKQTYPRLTIEEKHLQFWLNLRDVELLSYIDIDQEELKVELTSSYFSKLGIKDKRYESEVKQIASYNSINVKSLIKVQALIRGVLCRKLYQMQLEKARRDQTFIQEDSDIRFICKNGYVYEESESFLFKLYFRPKPNNENLMFENPQLAAKNNFAFIIIQAINLNRQSRLRKVETIKQKLPARISQFEVQRHSPKILKQAFLKIGRNQQLRIIAPNIEQIMIDSSNVQRMNDGNQIKQMDPELQQKLIFNKEILVKKRSQYKSLVNFCQFDSNVSKNIQPSQIGDLCQKIIFYKYHNYLDQRKIDVLLTKNIQDLEQLKEKANEVFPSTDFTKKILSFMENRALNKEDDQPKRPKLDAQVVELNIRRSIQGNEFTLDVYYDQNARHIIVQYQSDKNKNFSALIVNIGLVAFTVDWNIDVLKRNLEDLLIQQLRNNNAILYFEENKIMKRRNEALQQQQSAVVNTIINQVQIQKKEEKKSQLQVSLFNIINKSILLDVNFHPSQFKFILNISQKTNLTAKSSVEIPLTWFGCPQLKNIIEEKDLQGLQTLLYPLVQELLEFLNVEFNPIKQQYTYDLAATKKNMPFIIQNYFALKIQKKFQAAAQRNNYQFQRVISNQKEIHLNSNVSISTNIYFQKRWYLVKDQFKLKVIIERYPKSANKGQKKAYSLDLLELKKQFLELANQKGIQSRMDREYLNLIDNKWTDIQGVFSKSYYVKEFTDLINYLNKQLQVTILYSKIYVSINDPIFVLKEEKTTSLQLIKKKGTKGDAFQKFRAIVSAVTCIQRCYRKFKRLEWQQLKSQRKKEKESYIKPLGVRIKRAFKEVDGSMYVVNVYQRENLYTFDLILFDERREKKNKKVVEMIQPPDQNSPQLKIDMKQLETQKKLKKEYRGQYEYNTNSLLNTGAQTIPDYLLDRIAIKEDELIFRENVFKEFQPGAYQNVKRHEQEDSQSQYRFNEQIENEQFKVNSTQSNIASNLVNYSFQEDQGKQFIYNVVYTGQKPQTSAIQIGDQKSKLAKSKFLKEVPEEANNDQKPQLQGQPNQEILETEENENEDNIVRINVDLNELKKLYPTIDSKSQGLMKVIGEQLIEGIKLEENGKVLIDQSKLNPKCIEIEEYNVNMNNINKKIEEMKKAEEDINLRNKLLQQNQTVQENRKTLLKQTRFFSKQKYLILIYIIERKVKKIQNTGFDTVFEEYEVLYQINCINLSAKNQNPIIWEITPEEVLVVSDGIKDNMERARYLMRRIVVFNQKIIFTVNKKQHISRLKPCSNVIVYYELGLIPIQNHFRNRRFRRNFQNYKDEVKLKNPNIMHKCIPEELKSLTQYYLLVCVDCKEANDKWELIVWDLVTFDRFSKVIKSTEFLSYAEEFGREVTVEFIAKFVDIDPASNELSINSGVSAYFKQYKEELKKKKLRRDLIERKKLQEDPYA